MENNELQKIWKDKDLGIEQKSKDELEHLLNTVTRQTINKFLIITGAGILSGLGLLIFLILTSINRPDDPVYLVNNVILGIIALISLISGLMSWHKIQHKDYNQPLRNWLEERIKYLSKVVKGKFHRLYILIIPIVYALTVLSIHVYFENKPFLDVIHTGESVAALIVGAPIGLFVSFFGAKKIHKQQSDNLEFLKDLHNRLCQVH